MKKNLTIIIVFFWCSILAACSISPSEIQPNEAPPLLSAEEKEDFFMSFWENINLQCDDLKLSKNICLQKINKGLWMIGTWVKIEYGQSLEILGLEFNKANKSILSLDVLSGAIEVKVKSTLNRNKEEIRQLQQEPMRFLHKGLEDIKISYFTLNAGDERTIELLRDFWNNLLHSQIEMNWPNWVGFDLEIRPIGWEAEVNYALSFQGDI